MVTELPQSRGGGDSEERVVVGEERENRTEVDERRGEGRGGGEREGERESIPSLISQRGFKKRRSFPIGGASEPVRIGRRQTSAGMRWRKPGLLVSVGPGSAMAPEPLPTGRPWWGAACWEVNLSHAHAENMFPLDWAVVRTGPLHDGNMDVCLVGLVWGSAGGCCCLRADLSFLLKENMMDSRLMFRIRATLHCWNVSSSCVQHVSWSRQAFVAARSPSFSSLLGGSCENQPVKEVTLESDPFYLIISVNIYQMFGAVQPQLLTISAACLNLKAYLNEITH